MTRRAPVALPLVTRAAAVGAALVLALASGCKVSPASPPVPSVRAAAWPEADQLFRRDPRWLGSDAAYSIDLGAGRVLWLFGDTFIANDAARTRANATFIRNSVGVERGSDPSQASVAFFWRSDASGKPRSFFAEAGGDWYWPGQGIRLDGTLLIFLSRVTASSGGLGFSAVTWDAALVDDPDDDPSAWQPRLVGAPANPWRLFVGAGVQLDGGYLVAYAQSDEGGHDLSLVRWPVDAARRGDLSQPAWWDGAAWTPQAVLARAPAVVISPGAPEFSVSRDPRLGRLVEVQADGFGPADLELRAADALTGPWSVERFVYRPPESELPRAMVYAGKAHPELTGAELVVTYATNNFDFSTVVNDLDWYFPRFVKVQTE